MERLCRFGEIDFENSGINLGKIGKKSTSFFIGKGVDKRMNEMRAAILYVRKNWHNKKLKENAVKDFEKKFGIKLVDKNWCDTPEFKKENSNYDLIKFYTTDNGYNEFFSRMNESLRSLDSSNLEKTLNVSASVTETAFLIECMNIELYNYMNEHKDAANFEGCVFRGMKVPKEVIDDFSHIKEHLVNDRKISVPMSFMSASKGIEIAKEFLELNKRKGSGLDERENLIMQINVANLSQESLLLYHSFFPDSVVSSLCAVPIEELSDHKNENEVLLRGAFFQALNFYKDQNLEVCGKPVYIIEVLMINANRDHITTTQFEETNARELFNTLVSIEKFKKLQEYISDEKALYFDEEKKYKAALQEEIEKAKKNLAAKIY